MSEDMNKKIQQIAELLGQDKMPDNVKGLLSMLVGSLENSEGTKSESAEEAQGDTNKNEQTKEEKPASDEAAISPDMLNKVKSLADNLRTGNDPRINLLHAIKPFMNNKRQKKIGNCIQLLQMTSLAKLMDNPEK